MKDRNSALLEVREESIGNLHKDSSQEEYFQNKTLRPIIKFQNDLLVEVFINYATKQKNVFFSLAPEKKMTYIDNAIQKDFKFRNSIKGIIIGMFTIEEYSNYILNSSNLNKRMMNMICERLKSQLQLITNN